MTFAPSVTPLLSCVVAPPPLPPPPPPPSSSSPQAATRPPMSTTQPSQTAACRFPLIETSSLCRPNARFCGALYPSFAIRQSRRAGRGTLDDREWQPAALHGLA